MGDAEVEGAAQDGALGLDGPVRAEVVPQAEREGGQLQAAAAGAPVGHVRVAVGVCGVQRDSWRGGPTNTGFHSVVTCGQWSNRRIRWDCADTLLNHGTAPSPALRRGRRGPALHPGGGTPAGLPVRPVGVDPGAGAGAGHSAVRADHPPGDADRGRPGAAGRGAPGAGAGAVGVRGGGGGAGGAARHPVAGHRAVHRRGPCGGAAGGVPAAPSGRGDQAAAGGLGGAGRGGRGGPAGPGVRLPDAGGHRPVALGVTGQ
ncbi:hypothetical protein SFUMM280S_06306 [Streptomyces fumanus]